jgi:ATP-dependent RNA helicase DDX54/DBP10
MRKIRSLMETKKKKLLADAKGHYKTQPHPENGKLKDDSGGEVAETFTDHNSMASDSELEVTFSRPELARKSRKKDRQSNPSSEAFHDVENFMSYAPRSHSFAEDRAYGVHSGSNTNFAEAARIATMDLMQDEAAKGFGEARGIMRWDKRQKKYVARQNDDDGSKGRRLVKGESGVKIAASFQSGRFDTWRKTQRLGRVPRVGEEESAASAGRGNGLAGAAPGKRYRHHSMKAPKPADKLRDDYEKRSKKIKSAEERVKVDKGTKELRSVEDIRKQRKLKERRREKNARPSRKGRR